MSFLKLLFFVYIRYLFWTEFGRKTEIGRANMDGTSKSYIVTKEIGWPNGLTIDLTCTFVLYKLVFNYT